MNRSKFLILAICLCINNVSLQAATYQNIQFTDLEKKIEQEAQTVGFVPLSAFLPFFSFVNIPDELRTILDNIKIAHPIVKATEREIKIAGSAMIDNVQIAIDMQLIKTAGVPQVHFELLLPKGAKPSDLNAKFGKLDFVKFESSGFIVSNYTYRDEEAGIDVESGVTFKAAISFDTLLEKMHQKIGASFSTNDFKKSISNAIVTQKLGVIVSGHIPMMLDDTTLKMELPLEFGIDFTVLRKKNGNPLFQKPLINKITLSRIIVEIGLKKVEPEVSLALGIFVYPASQPRPLEFQAYGKVAQSGIEIGGAMLGAFDPAFGLDWLSLGTFAANLPPLSLALWFDYGIATSTMALCGVPLPAGFTISGTLGLGKPEYRTTGSGAIKLKVETAGLSEFIFSGKIDQINFARLIQLLADLRNKRLQLGIDIPLINFRDIELTVSPFGGEIFGVKYEPGLRASGTLKVGMFNAGGVFGLGLTQEEPRFIVDAFMDPIEIKLPKSKFLPDGGTVVAISGYDETLKSKARLKIDIGGNRPSSEQVLKVDGFLKIPVISYAGGVALNLEKNILAGQGQGSFFEGKFTAKSSVSLNFDDPKDFEVAWNINNDFTPYLCSKLKEGFAVFKTKALSNLGQLDKEIKVAHENLSERTNQEKERVAAHIDQLRQHIKEMSPKSKKKLGKAIPGGSVLRVYNHTSRTLYCAMYIVDKKTKQSTLQGNILELEANTKDQLARPSLVKILKKDRDMFVSLRKEDLKNTLNEDDYYAMARKHVGSVYAKIHMAEEFGSLMLYTGSEWVGKTGYDLMRLAVELVAYKLYQEALLKPGTKLIDPAFVALHFLTMVPGIAVTITEKVLPVLDAGLQFINLKQAGLALAGKDIIHGKLPAITLNFDLNIPKLKRITVDVQDFQVNLKNPMPFILNLVGSMVIQLVPQFLSPDDKKYLQKQMQSDPDLQDLAQELEGVEL